MQEQVTQAQTQQSAGTATTNAPTLPKKYHNLYRIFGPNSMLVLSFFIIFVVLAIQVRDFSVVIMGLPFMIWWLLIVRQKVVATKEGLVVTGIFHVNKIPWSDIETIDTSINIWKLWSFSAVVHTETRNYDISSVLYGGWFYGTKLIGQINPWDKRNVAVLAEINTFKNLYGNSTGPTSVDYQQQLKTAQSAVRAQRDQFVQQTISKEKKAFFNSWIVRIGGGILLLFWTAVLAPKGGSQIKIWLGTTLFLVIFYIIYSRTKSKIAQILVYMALIVLVVIVLMNFSASSN